MSARKPLLYRLVSRLCDEVTVTRVLDPWQADFQFEVASASNPLRRAWIRVVHLFSSLRLVAALTWHSDGVPRAIAFQLAGIALTTIAFVTVPFWDPMSRVAPMRRPLLAILLIPQALAVSLTLGSLLGLIGLMGQAVTRPARTIVLTGAVLCSMMTAGVLQWVSPVANQMFRITYAQRVVARGFGEMSISELARAERLGSEPYRNSARRELQSRLTLTGASMALTLFLLTVVSRTRFPRAIGLATLVAYTTYFNYERAMIRPGDSALWVFAVAWGPSLALLAAASLSPSLLMTNLHRQRDRL